MRTVRTLVHAWLVLDFFGDARRSGGASSSLTTTIFTQSFLALVFAALLYPETPPIPFAAANLSLSSLLVAIGALGEHDQRNRRQADQALLATAPVTRTRVVLARSGHAAFYVCLVTIGMALPPAILLAFLRHEPAQVPAYVLLACACSGLATGALGVLVRGLGRCFGLARAALLAGTIKALLLGGGLVLFALAMRSLQKTADDLPIGRLGAELLPTYQAARLLAAPAAEAWRLLPFVGGALLLLLLGIVLGETEPSRAPRHSSTSMLRRLLRRLAGQGPRLAVAEFVAVSIWRSAGFRSRVLPLLGLPAGMVFLTLQGDERAPGFVFTCLLLQIPAIYLPFLIAFLPRADQTDTGWVFDQAPTLPQEVVRDATWRALVTHVLLPVHGLALVLLLACNPAPLDCTAASLFALATAVLAARPMLRSLEGVPFTRNRDADAATDLGALFTSAIALGGLGTLFGGLLAPALRWPLALGAVVLAGLSLRRRAAGGPPAVPSHGADDRAAGPREPHSAPGGGEPQVAPEQGDAPVPPAAPEASLRRELQAVAVLYVAVAILPTLVGAMFAV